jgi:hypothetical protein
MLGTFDEDVLCGRLVDGKRVGGEVGKIISSPAGHMWLANAVEGVTDVLPEATRYAEDKAGGVLG